MKQAKTYVLIIGMVIVASLMLTEAFGQNRFDSALNKVENIKKSNIDTDTDIKMVFNVYLDNVSKETAGVIIQITDIKSGNISTMSINQSFSVYLRHDKMYCIKISHTGYNSKTILVNTKAPYNNTWEINTGMYLYSDRPDEMAGVLYYNPKIDNFESKPYNGINSTE